MIRFKTVSPLILQDGRAYNLLPFGKILVVGLSLGKLQILRIRCILVLMTCIDLELEF